MDVVFCIGKVVLENRRHKYAVSHMNKTYSILRRIRHKRVLLVTLRVFAAGSRISGFFQESFGWH